MLQVEADFCIVSFLSFQVGLGFDRTTASQSIYGSDREMYSARLRSVDQSPAATA